MGTGPALPDPGRDEDPPGLPAGPDDFPRVGSDRWRLLPSGADWPDWTRDEAYLAGIIVWTTPAGRRYTTEPTRYPI